MCLSRIPPAAQRRSFVSTVLLARTWENETVVELRRVAKERGLSTKGNKSTLIARIHEHEQNNSASTSLIRTPGTVRSAATNVTPAVFPQKVSQAASPGIPLALQSNSVSTKSNPLTTKLPDLSRPHPNALAQIPYLPDFWNSARPRADDPLELEPPKLHVVSGSVTHYDGGPTHDLERPEGGAPSTAVQTDDPPVSRDTGFWADFWESLGLPRSFSARRTLFKPSNSAVQTGEEVIRSRPLTDEERKGLYVLLGIIGGSWLVGGLMN